MGHARKVMLSFFLTTKCNLRCGYCYTRKEEHADQTIPWEFAQLGIDTFLVNVFPPHIRFFGAGEPTTEIDLMRRIVDYAREKVRPRDLTVELQTNGVFEEEVVGYLGENADIVWVSCDGLPETHDYYRRTIDDRASSPDLERNVRYLVRYGKGVTGIRATVTEESLGRQGEMLDYFAGLGVKYVWSDPVFANIGERSDSIGLDLMEYAREFLEAQEKAELLGITYGSILTCNFDERVRYHCRACLPTPHLTTDGYVSACDMALFGEDQSPMSIFIYGKWDRKTSRILFEESKIAELRKRTVENLPGCRGCFARERCGGYCPGEVTNESGSLFGKKPSVCEPIRYLARHMDSGKVKYRYLHP